MKKIQFLLALIIMIQPVFGEVWINEVLYNPLSTENGGEAVVIYNDGNNDVDVSGWVLATKTSSRDATLPNNTSIRAGGYLLIADNGFSLNRDDSSWPDPNYEEAITLGNSDAWVSLINNNKTIDTVGWGDAAEFFEGTPHPGAEEGKSLLRVSYTNDNSIDFIESTPVFFEVYNPLKVIIDVEVNVSEEKDIIKEIKIMSDDNSSEEGVQINPVAGKTKRFEVFVETFNENFESKKLVIGEREFELEEFESNETSIIFRGEVLMKYYENARNYEVKAVFKSNGTEYTKSISFEFTSLSAIEVNKDLNFNVQSKEEIIDNIILQNVGNEDLLLKIKGRDIPFENLFFSVDEFETSSKLSENYQDLKTISNGKNSAITISLKLLGNNLAENYRGEIIVFGETI
ncbi:lamin tail domain-containing protein [Bacteroidota bacterium]